MSATMTAVIRNRAKTTPTNAPPPTPSHSTPNGSASKSAKEKGTKKEASVKSESERSLLAYLHKQVPSSQNRTHTDTSPPSLHTSPSSHSSHSRTCSGCTQLHSKDPLIHTLLRYTAQYTGKSHRRTYPGSNMPLRNRDPSFGTCLRYTAQYTGKSHHCIIHVPWFKHATSKQGSIVWHLFPIYCSVHWQTPPSHVPWFKHATSKQRSIVWHLFPMNPSAQLKV